MCRFLILLKTPDPNPSQCMVVLYELQPIPSVRVTALRLLNCCFCSAENQQCIMVFLVLAKPPSMISLKANLVLSLVAETSLH